MAGERPNPTCPAAQDANYPPTFASNNLSHVYIRLDQAVGSCRDQPPLTGNYGRDKTPYPNPMARHWGQLACPTLNQSAPTMGNPAAFNQGNQAPQPPQQPQQMYKKDIEAVKTLVGLSTKDCAKYNERNGL